VQSECLVPFIRSGRKEYSGAFSFSTRSQRTVAMISRVYVASNIKSSTSGNHLLQLWPSTRLHSVILLLEYLWIRMESYVFCFALSSMFRREEQHSFLLAAVSGDLAKASLRVEVTRISLHYSLASPPFFGPLKLFEGGVSLP
jgi:hypothetical protein